MRRFKNFILESTFSGTDLINPDYRDDIIQAIKDDELSIDDKPIIIANKEELLALIDSLKTKSDIESKVNRKKIVKIDDGDLVTFTKIDKHPFTTGSAKITAAQWEMIICAAYNLKGEEPTEDNMMGALGQAKIKKDKWQPKFDAKIEAAQKIVSDRRIKLGGKMEHFGSDNVDVSETWKRYYKNLRSQTTANFAASTKTPKTDMHIGKKIRISLKKVGGSQLMSGKDIDSWGTIKAGIEYSQDLLKDSDFKTPLREIKKNLKNEFTNQKLSDRFKTVTDAQKAIAKGTTTGNEIIDWVVKQTSMQEAVMKGLNQIMGKNASINLAIRRGMVHEAMTGSVKFGPDSMACATHIMKFSPSGELVQFDTIGDPGSKLVGEVAKKVKIDVKFKSSGSGGTAWSALKMILGETFEEMGGHLLTEEQMINENFIFRWIGKWLDRIWKKIVSVAKRSISAIAEAFGLKMDIKVGPITI